MENSTYTCVVCPVSCTIDVIPEENGGYRTSGNQCKRGERYAISEHTHPVRMITTTVAVKHSVFPRLPVISDGEVPKEKLMECMNEIYRISVEAPIKCGDIVMNNICGTGVNIVSAKTAKRKE